MKKTIPAATFALFAAMIAFAQSMQEANALFQAQKWNDAAKAYEAITKADSSNGLAWFRLGLSLHSLGQYRKAIDAFAEAQRLNFNAPGAMFRMGRAYAKMGQRDEAFEWLKKAVGAGFTATPQIQLLNSDPDIASLREDGRFKEVMDLVERVSKPCMYSEKARQFDFWIGEWDVQTAQGQRAGTNKIERIEDGCIILENWTGAAGGTGKSLNFYDSAIRKWRQVWVDSFGNMSEFVGEFRDGAMRYEGETHMQGGGKILRRLTFFNLGADRVRQFSERSTDGGKTWTVGYDFTYIRKK
ncbi:MAG: tetratricopeptide repeat protein [Acidobacteriota bacterium]